MLGLGLSPLSLRNPILFDFYVDALIGSDENNGLSQSSAFATFDHALSVASATDVIGLKGGQNHIYRQSGTLTETDANFQPYGSGVATLDSRQHLTGATWAQVEGTTNCWQTTVTFLSATVNNGVLSNSFTYHLWFPDDDHGAWKVGGADIATNIAAVDAEAGAYTVYKSGSTVQDPRSDTAGTDYVYVVNAGGDPNGLDISISDRGILWFFGSGTTKNMRFIGSSAKDFSSSSSAPFPVFENHTKVDCNQHGHVGPCRVVGTYTATGLPIPGTAKGIATGRCDGGGLNLYSINDLSTYDIAIDRLDLANFSAALYGHGSGNLLYNNVNVQQITAANCGTVIQFDVINSTNRTPVIVGTTTVESVTATGVGFLINAGGTFVVNGGHVEFSSDLDDVQQTLVRFNGTADVVTLRNMTWRFQFANGVSWKNNIYSRVGDLTHTTPILTLDNCQDISDAGKQGAAFRSAAYSSTVELHLINGTSIGSIMDQATGTNYPAGLYVESGCTFGMGDRTGPQIETALTGASIPFDISGDTTIVNRAGTVLSAPGWK